MAESTTSQEQLGEEYKLLKYEIDDMEAMYQRKLNQARTNPDISKAKKDLRKTRQACVELTNERDVLLDRIAELEQASRVHPDPSITSRVGTDKDTRLKGRIQATLNDSLNLDLDPYSTSRHCGPEAKQQHHQNLMMRASLQQQQTNYEQGFPIKAEPDKGERDIIKLPKRARASKQSGANTIGSSGATSAASGPMEPPTTNTSNTGNNNSHNNNSNTVNAAAAANSAAGPPLAPSSSPAAMRGLPNDMSQASVGSEMELEPPYTNIQPLVSRSGTRIRIKPIQDTRADNGDAGFDMNGEPGGAASLEREG